MHHAPPEDDRLVPGLAAAWEARSIEVRAELEHLLTQLERLIRAPSPAPADVEAAESTAHRLAGVFGAFERPHDAQAFRSVSEALLAQQPPATADLIGARAAASEVQARAWRQAPASED